MKVAINGFGRIGHNLFHALNARVGVELVAVNDLGDASTHAHLLTYDTVLGVLPEPVTVDEAGDLVHEGRVIRYSSERSLDALDWSGVDVVFEASGVFTARADAAKHLAAGARKVIVTAPSADADVTVVMGVNEDEYDATLHDVVSNASCTTNCLAPVLKALQPLGIEQGFMTTVHSYTNDQGLLDVAHKDLRRARAAAVNIIPTSTGAAKAIGVVLPELAGKLNGYALRVPTPNGSLVDVTLEVSESVSVSDVNALLYAAANEYGSVLAYTDAPIVLSDIVGNPASAVVDGLLTDVQGRLVKVVAWYDNEWGYTNRLLDLAEFMLLEQ